jgi:hypothetical protein
LQLCSQKDESDFRLYARDLLVGHGWDWPARLLDHPEMMQRLAKGN